MLLFLALKDEVFFVGYLLLNVANKEQSSLHQVVRDRPDEEQDCGVGVLNGSNWHMFTSVSKRLSYVISLGWAD
jgi:hypothetical protein